MFFQRFNNETGEWRHQTNSVFRDRKWLGHVTFSSSGLSFKSNPLSQEGEVESSYQQCIDVAKQTLASAVKLASRETVPDQTLVFPDSVSALRWFMTPSEAKSCLLGESVASIQSPFSPLPTQPPSSSAYHGSLSSHFSLSSQTVVTLSSVDSK